MGDFMLWVVLVWALLGPKSFGAHVGEIVQSVRIAIGMNLPQDHKSITAAVRHAYFEGWWRNAEDPDRVPSEGEDTSEFMERIAERDWQDYAKQKGIIL